jgi:hypothetical protein
MFFDVKSLIFHVDLTAKIVNFFQINDFWAHFKEKSLKKRDTFPKKFKNFTLI